MVFRDIRLYDYAGVKDRMMDGLLFAALNIIAIGDFEMKMFVYLKWIHMFLVKCILIFSQNIISHYNTTTHTITQVPHRG